jgi:hypothetical protein
VIVAAALCGGAFCAAPAHPAGDQPAAQNLAVIQRMARSVAEEIARSFPAADSAGVVLTIVPRDYGWTIEFEVARAFDRRNYHVVASSESARVAVELGIADAGVKYQNPRRDGLFGSRVVDRTVRLTITSKVIDLERKSVLLLEQTRRETTDVVQNDLIDRLQTPGIPMTQGDLPPEGFFDGWLEPIILIGAIAVGVYLLFTMRS